MCFEVRADLARDQRTNEIGQLIRTSIVFCSDRFWQDRPMSNDCD